MELEEEIKRIEKELADIIVEKLKENKLDVETAEKLAADFLAILPIHTKKELLAKLKELADKYDVAEQIYVEELGKITQTDEKNALNTMRDLIHQGKIEEAIQTAKSLYTS